MSVFQLTVLLVQSTVGCLDHLAWSRLLIYLVILIEKLENTLTVKLRMAWYHALVLCLSDAELQVLLLHPGIVGLLHVC